MSMSALRIVMNTAKYAKIFEEASVVSRSSVLMDITDMTFGKSKIKILVDRAVHPDK